MAGMNETGGHHRRSEPAFGLAEDVVAARTGDWAGWHPKLRTFYDYWRSIHPRTGLPRRQDFDPTCVPALLPGMWLLDVQHVPFRLRYRLVGTRIVTAIGREVTGLWLDEAHPHIAGDAWYLDRYRRVVASAVPSRRRGRVMLWQHDDYRDMENLAVPFADDGRTPNILAILTVLYRIDGTAW